MIATLTMNPALDKSTSVSRITPERKLRCDPMIVEAGGGGINVSKAIHELGGLSLAIFPAGGNNGNVLQGLLKAKNISCRSVQVQSETREDFNVIESDTNAQYRFVMPGNTLQENELADIIRVISNINPFPDFMVASGSLPPGAPDDFYSKVAEICKVNGSKFFIDTSGNALSEAAAKGVYLLKPNLSELCCLCGTEYLQLREIDDAAKEIVNKRFCEIAVVSLGAGGALLVTKDEKIKVVAPPVKKVSTVGAGDSMLAGIVWMLQQGHTLRETIQFGVACGTAATMNPGSKLFIKEDVWRLYDWLTKHDN